LFVGSKAEFLEQLDRQDVQAHAGDQGNDGGAVLDEPVDPLKQPHTYQPADEHGGQQTHPEVATGLKNEPPDQPPQGEDRRMSDVKDPELAVNHRQPDGDQDVR
jgi:hypothetical protein